MEAFEGGGDEDDGWIQSDWTDLFVAAAALNHFREIVFSLFTPNAFNSSHEMFAYFRSFI